MRHLLPMTLLAAVLAITPGVALSKQGRCVCRYWVNR